MRRVAVFRHDLLQPSETFIHSQVCCLRNWSATLVGRNRVSGIALDDLPVCLIPPPASIKEWIRERLQYWLNRPVGAVVRAFKSLDVALVHAHFGTDATDIWPSVRAAGLPLLVTLHGYDINTHEKWWRSGSKGLRRRLYPRALLRMARDPSVTFVAVSNAIKDRAMEKGIPAEKITVSYIGVDTERFTPGRIPLSRRSKRIVFIGRMVESKDPLLLVRAFSIVREAVPDAELVMVGSGPMLEAAKREAAELQARVEFPGHVSPDEVRAQLHRALVLCLPSRIMPDGTSEGLGQVLLEAQSCGLPVIGSDAGGIPEALRPGVTGQLFPQGDASALAECLMSVLRLPEGRLDALSEECRNWVKSKFELRSMTSQLEDIYDAVRSD